MPELNQLVADRMKSVLTAQHLTIGDYAKRANQDVQKVARRLRGEVPITIADIDTFSAVTGYTPDEFLKSEFVLKTLVTAGSGEVE